VVAPFRGVRYIPHQASGIANVTSPPYDVIGATALDELLTADPHNVVRLILPARSPDDSDACPGDAATVASRAGDANARAARRLRGWLRAGILATDPEPALYVYEQLSPGWMQRGLIALVRVGDPESSGIFPHEDVMPGPVHDRRDLMAATQANLEPIFLVYGADAGHCGLGRRSRTTETVNLVAETSPPLVTAVTRDAITHRLWRLPDPALHAAIAADLAGRTALIADGHHRYAAYQALREQLRAGGHGDGPWDFGLAYLVDADAYPPRLGAIHRVIPRLRPADAAARAAGSFTVTETGEQDLAALERLAKAGHDGPAFLLAGASPVRFWLLTAPDRALADAMMPAASSSAWRALDAAILQRLLFAHAWGIEDNDQDVPVFHDATEAVGAATECGGVAVISNPVPFSAVTEIARHGERVPRKSTSFGPKPRSGLVLRKFLGSCFLADARQSPAPSRMGLLRACKPACGSLGLVVAGFGVWLGRGVRGGQGLVNRVVDGEDLAQAGDLEDPQDAALRDDQVDGSVVGAHALEAAYQDAEAG
jgi:uncharacterized protein (DUF1015 family)